MKLEIPDKYFNEEELKNTPIRWKKFMEEWLENSNDFNFTVFENPDYDEMVIVSGETYSLCSHHLLPIHLKWEFGYIPDKKICGMSKVSRVIDKFSHKPQLQEKLTVEIIDYLESKLQSQGMMLIMEGEHLCCRIRGVKNKGKMITSAVVGLFKDDIEVKQEFLSLIKGD